MPIDRKDSRSDRFLEELRDPPVALFIKGADRNSPDNNRSTSFRVIALQATPSPARNGKFVLKRAPADERSGAIDIQ